MIVTPFARREIGARRQRVDDAAETHRPRSVLGRQTPEIERLGDEPRSLHVDHVIRLNLRRGAAEGAAPKRYRDAR